MTGYTTPILDERVKVSVTKFFLNKNYEIGINYLAKKLEAERMSDSLKYCLLDIFIDLPPEIQKNQEFKSKIVKRFPEMINKIEQISETNLEKFLNDTEQLLNKITKFKNKLGEKIDKLNSIIKKTNSNIEKKFYNLSVAMFGEDPIVEKERKYRELEEFLLKIDTKTSEIRIEIPDRKFITKFNPKIKNNIQEKLETGFEELGIAKKQNSTKIDKTNDNEIGNEIGR